jgi:hypothetical protein
MNIAEIWSNVSGMWFGQFVDARTGIPGFLVFTAASRGGVIAEMRYRFPRATLEFKDRLCPTDP